MRIKRSRKVVVAASIAIVMAGGAAFAYWAFGGAGNGSATTASNPTSGIVVTQFASTGGLAPGQSVDLAGALTNPNKTDIKVGTLTATITSVSGGATAADFTLTGSPVINAVIKTGAPLPWSGIKLAYANSDVNQDNGKSVSVGITYSLSAFQENVLPALGTYRVLDVNGVKTFDLYIHTVYTGSAGGYVIVPGDTLSTYDTNATWGNPAWANNVATADASGNIRYTGPVPTPGHIYQITVMHNGSYNSFYTRLS